MRCGRNSATSQFDTNLKGELKKLRDELFVKLYHKSLTPKSFNHLRIQQINHTQ